MTEIPITFVYHGDCHDGFGARMAMETHPLQVMISGTAVTLSVQYIAGKHGQLPDLYFMAKRHVIMADFSYPRGVLESIASVALSVAILDHHKTARDDLDGLAPLPDTFEEWISRVSSQYSESRGDNPAPMAALFDMGRSGAAIAWQWFHPDRKLPRLIEYVQDRDLWKFELLHSKAIHAYVSSFRLEVESWKTLIDELESVTGLNMAFVIGSILLRKKDIDIESCLKNGVQWMSIGGLTVPVANLPSFLASDGCARIIQKTGSSVAASYTDVPGAREFSIRSDGSVDVSAIAKSYGGGGHPAASGFKMFPGWMGDGPNPGEI